MYTPKWKVKKGLNMYTSCVNLRKTREEEKYNIRVKIIDIPPTFLFSTEK